MSQPWLVWPSEQRLRSSPAVALHHSTFTVALSGVEKRPKNEAGTSPADNAHICKLWALISLILTAPQANAQEHV
jgi:hypothetical protein